MSKEYLFSYGTLQKEKTQLELFGRKLQGSADTLWGYKIIPIEIRDKLFLSKGENKYQKTLMATSDRNDLVKGSVLELSSDELLLADKYEPDNYKRIKVKLESGKEAWIYIATEAVQ
jgi:gamma-glutamylcyclotransferase (GGCT)/AIG2-like uncharacterized protein YtfP